MACTGAELSNESMESSVNVNLQSGVKRQVCSCAFIKRCLQWCKAIYVIKKSVSQSVSRSISRSVTQSVTQSIRQSINALTQWHARKRIGDTVCHVISLPSVHVKQSCCDCWTQVVWLFNVNMADKKPWPGDLDSPSSALLAQMPCKQLPPSADVTDTNWRCTIFDCNVLNPHLLHSTTHWRVRTYICNVQNACLTPAILFDLHFSHSAPVLQCMMINYYQPHDRKCHRVGGSGLTYTMSWVWIWSLPSFSLCTSATQNM